MAKFAPLNLTPEEITRFTPLWQGERSADGRPRVADSVIERLRTTSITQAWGVLRGEGYHWQYEGGFVCTQPGGVLVGRAVTAMWMPRRDDVRAFVFEQALAQGNVGDHVSWPIDTLVPGDVYVADVFGKVADGPLIGDNLATSILAKSGNGVVHDAAIRDVDGVKELTGFVAYSRGYHPSFASPTIVLMGINCPVRIGGVSVMPGDVVLGRDDGVVFIPPHLAERVAQASELIQLRDLWGKRCLAEGRYTPGEIDRRWDPPIEADFRGWVEANLDALPVPKETAKAYLAGTIH